jgi:hypothetical protein
MVRVKYVSSKQALEQLAEIYATRGLQVVWSMPGKVEAYDRKGVLRNIAAVKA